MPSNARVTPCLWFDHETEEAANYCVGIFKNSRIRDIGRYGEAGKEIHGRPRCKDQAEVDYHWEKLTAGGATVRLAQGQVRSVLAGRPARRAEAKLLSDQKSAASQRAMTEMMRQKKPDIAAMQRAYDG